MKVIKSINQTLLPDKEIRTNIAISLLDKNLTYMAKALLGVG